MITIRTRTDAILLFSGVLLTLAPLVGAQAQDVDVPGNLTMHDSTDSTVGNLLKEGAPFLHNFGTSNTFLGTSAGNFTMSGGYNTAVGSSVFSSNTTGSQNIAIGVDALSSNTTGNYNTASGSSALYSNTTGLANTASGLSALQNNTTGSNNTASGSNSLSFNTTGDENTAIGGGALFSNSTGDLNTASGASALIYNTTGSNNTASGSNALRFNTTGSFNIASGANALFYNSTGSYNTAIGYGAGVPVGVGGLANATAIGAGAVVNASNKVRFGNEQVTVIEGQVPYTYTSDRDKKEDFRPVDAEAVLSKLRGLSVTSWNYKGQDRKHFRHYGPVAQDFFAAFGHDAVGTIGTPTTISSGDLDGILMIAAQALEKRTVEQEKEIVQLKARLEVLERRLSTDIATSARVRL